MRHSGDYRAAARGFASGTPDGLAAWLVLSCRALQAGAGEALSIARGHGEIASQQSEAGDAPNWFGSPPASTDSGYQACCGLRGWPRRLDDALRLQPHPRGRRGRPLFAITQARNTFAYFAALAPRGCRDPCWAAWLREFEPSLPARALASPGFRASFVLRDPGHSKGESPRDLIVTPGCQLLRQRLRTRTDAAASRSARRPASGSHRPRRWLRRRRRDGAGNPVAQ